MTTNRVTIVTDLGYGDAGKGSIVDYLTRSSDAELVVRFNGGAQAAHNVVTPDGRHHTFSQFGSGTFVGNTRTHLSRYMLVNPLGLHYEAQALARLGVADVFGRLSIDERALVVSPYQQAMNRLRELARGTNRHGSCGQGIGETMADHVEAGQDVLTAGDLLNPDRAYKKLETLRLFKLEQLEVLRPHLPKNQLVQREIDTLQDARMSRAVVEFYHDFVSRVAIVDENHLPTLLRQTRHTLFEGAQGVLLDEWYGFHPYTTWSTTTNANALALLDEAGYAGSVRKLGLLRAYATRHGAGPFVTEDAELSAALPDSHNGVNDWQQGFRVGYFDAVTARYALDVVGPLDGLVITCLDRLHGRMGLQIATGYDGPEGYVSRLERAVVPDLAHQEALTRRLLAARPIYETFNDGVFGWAHTQNYLTQLEAHLNQPVWLISTGPTAYDKLPFRSC